MHIRESITFNGKELSLETGQIARQATGAVLVKHGETHVLVTVVTGPAREDIDYFPLRVDYEERFYASGKIPGGFFKREGRPSDAAVLAGRMIDRPIRPLFPKQYNDEVQIVATVLSVEPECPPGVLAILGASAALSISDAPFQGPIAGVSVGRNKGQFVLNPEHEALEETGVHITVAGTSATVTMVEGMMCELSENQVVEAIAFAHQAIRELIALQDRFVQRIQPKKKDVPPAQEADPALVERVRQIVWNEFASMHTLESKKARSDHVEELTERAIAQIVSPDAPADEAAVQAQEVSSIAETLLKEYMRQQILERGLRLDGRRPEEIRPITCQVGVLPRAHGSSIFTRGETQSLGIVTLGATRGDEQIIDQMMVDGRKRFMLHYNFPPFSVGEVGRIGSPSRRSIGHGYLAENSVRSVLPDEEDFPYVVRIVSEILESNGSSSMATVCSASLAMMDAGVPIQKPVAGIAMGMIEDAAANRRVILTDIQGTEDHLGDMDFKVVGTKDGVTGFQLDVKVGGINADTMREALEQARRARLAILAEMDRAIPAARPELSQYAPKLITITIPVEKIGMVIGPGGKMIRRIIDETGADIDIADDGTVKIAAVDGESASAAQEWIEDLTAELEVGAVFKAKVTRVVDFGAFVELKNGSEGLVHVSNLASGFVDNVRDIVSPGDELMIEVIGEDKMGRPDLRRIEDGDEPRGPTKDRKGGRAARGGGGGSEKPKAPAANIKAGDIIDGTVTNTTDYGAFVELAPDVTGLIHISALSDEYVRRVTDVVRSGDPVKVEVMNIDDRGRYKLRRIVEGGEKSQETAKPEHDESQSPAPEQATDKIEATPQPSDAAPTRESQDPSPKRASQDGSPKRESPEASQDQEPQDASPKRESSDASPKHEPEPEEVEEQEEKPEGFIDRW